MKKHISRWGVSLLVLSLTLLMTSCDRNTTPAITPSGSTGPDIQTWHTSNGAKVIYVHSPQLPMLDVRVVFDAGSARDDMLGGVALLTNSLLDQGAGKWNADTIAERFDQIGAAVGNDALVDMAIVSLRSLTQPEILQQALDTFTVLLTQPTFAQSDLDRLRKQVLISLTAQEQSPGDIAEHLFNTTLFGKHPYANQPHGTRESVQKITVSDIRNFYKKYYVAKNAVIALVGAVDRTQAEAIANQLVSKLPAGEHAPAVPPVEDLAQPRREVKQFPSTQTHILVGQPGMSRTDPDFMPLYVGNRVLGGGGFGSRIMTEVREKRGLAYSSYSYFAPMTERGAFVMGLQTKNGQTEEALKVMMQTLDEFVAKGPTKEELQHAKNSIIGGFALRLDSNRDIVEYMSMIAFYDLPLDYLQTFNHRVDAVTVKQIKEAFQRRIQPDRMVTVLVGDQVK